MHSLFNHTMRPYYHYLDDGRLPEGPSGPRHQYIYAYPANISRRICFGVASDENLVYRLDMQDDLTVKPVLPTKTGLYSFMAVFDGKNGKAAAQWCAQNLHEVLLEEES
jgi:hypothetical protein